MLRRTANAERAETAESVFIQNLYDLRGFRVSKDQKSRALTALETVGLISVERQLRKSPLVTLTWKPIKK